MAGSISTARWNREQLPNAMRRGAITYLKPDSTQMNKAKYTEKYRQKCKECRKLFAKQSEVGKHDPGRIRTYNLLIWSQIWSQTRYSEPVFAKRFCEY